MRALIPVALLMLVAAAPAAADDHTVLVSTSDELAAAIAAAVPGETIVLADGTYAFGTVAGKSGTETEPITITAAHPGAAVIATGRPQIADSHHLVVKDLSWRYPAAAGSFTIARSTDVRLTGNRFRLGAVTDPVQGKSYHWVVVSGPDSGHNRVDHNLFEGKRQLGNYVEIADNTSQVSQHDRVDHNYFRDETQIIGSDGKVANGGEAIRVGVSTESESSGYAVIEDNLFENCDSDAEIISMKTAHNTVRYNTIRASYGVVSARRGDYNSYYGNFFFGEGKAGAGGIRVYGSHQRIYDNYFEGLTGTAFQAAVQLGGGTVPYDADRTDPANWAQHWQVYAAVVVNNTFVDNASGIETAGDYPSYGLPPVDSVIADNVLTSGQGKLINEVLPPTRLTLRSNIAYPTGTATVGVTVADDQVRVIDPDLVERDGLYRLAATSPAIDAASGAYEFVTTDMDGQPRTRTDIGADEYSDAPVLHRPLTAADFADLTG